MNNRLFFISAFISALILYSGVKTVLGQPSGNLPVSWMDTPGVYDITYYARRGFSDECKNEDGSSCTSVLMTVNVNTPWCFRYLEPKVIYDGREIKGHVTEVGTPGEPGWNWEFRTDEIFVGSFIWHVTTVDVCPKEV